MPFEGILRSKISSLLRPWLREDTDMELKLGLLWCQVTWRDLELDTANLDSLISAATRLTVQRVSVAELALLFSPWASPVIQVSVRGFQAVLAPRVLPEGSNSVLTEVSHEEGKKEGVDAIDPEGALLRQMLESALKNSSRGRWLTTLLTEALLRHCRLLFQDASIQLQFTGESNGFLLMARELTVGTQPLGDRSLSRGITEVFFMFRKDNYSLMFRCSSLELGSKDNDVVKILISSKDPQVCIRLKRLRPMRFATHFPLIECAFSPLDIPVIFLALDLLSAQPEGSRGGKVLWRIAAQRIELLSHHPRISWCKLINLVLLWLSYVHAYESLLSLIGYSDENMFKEISVRMCNDLGFKGLVQHKMMTVDALEKQLPIEALGRARQIARQRLLLCAHVDVSVKAGLLTSVKRKLTTMLLFVYTFVFLLVRLISNVMLFLNKPFKRCQPIDKDGLFFSWNCVSLSFNELFITLHPMNIVHNISRTKADLGRDISQLTFSPVFLGMRSFCLRHVMTEIGQSFFIALGDFQVRLSPSSRILVIDDEFETKSTPSFRVPKAEVNSSSQGILWTEPAHLPHPLGVSVDTTTRSSTVGVQAMILENSLREVWASWKTVSEELRGINFHPIDHPCFLLDFKNVLINPNINKSVNGALRCNLALGKLHVDLDCSSIVSFAQLFGQACGSLYWILNIVIPQNPPCPDSCIEQKKLIKLEQKLDMHVCRIKNVILNLMPDNNVQVGAVITGPSVKVSFHSFLKSSSPALSYFSLDLEDIFLAVWPASRTTLLELNPWLELEAPQEYLWLKEPLIPDTPEGKMSENFVSRGKISQNIYMEFDGLSAYFSNLEGNQRRHILKSTSMKINASTCRKYLHSFYSTENTCSISLSMVAGEIDMFLYMEELWFVVQVLQGIIVPVSAICVNFNYPVSSSSQEYIKKLISIRKDTVINHQICVNAEKENLCLQSKQFTINTHLEFDQLDVVLEKSRKRELALINTDSESCSLFSLPDTGMVICLPHLYIHISCKERHIKLFVDLPELQFLILKPPYEIDMLSNGVMVRDVYHQSRQLYGCFLSPFILHLSVGFDGDFMSSTDRNPGDDTSPTKSVEKGGSLFPIASKVTVVQSTSIPAPGFCFIAELEVGDVIVANCDMKDLWTGQRQSCRVDLLTSSFGGFHTVNFGSQGGYFFLETYALAMFIQSINAYFLCFSNFQPWTSNKQCERDEDMSTINDNVAGPSNLQGDTEMDVFLKFLSKMSMHWFFKSFDIVISQFSVTFAVVVDPAVVQCLTLETDINLKLTSSERSLCFNILNLTLLSQLLYKKNLSAVRNVIISPCTMNSNGLQTCVRCDSPTGKQSGLNNAQSSKAFSEREISLDTDKSESSSLRDCHYILKHLYASFVLKKSAIGSETTTMELRSDWSGHGSISGVDFIFSLSEIQMLLAMFSPLMKTSRKTSTKVLKGSFHSQMQGQTNDPSFTIADGAIVAIQDIHQHLYLAVEVCGVKYCLVGVLHYSLVGERAFFRVRLHTRKPLLLSLTSLHAKDDAGELHLIFRQGSGLVEISSSYERGCDLWKIIPCKADNYVNDGDDMEFYSYCTSPKKSFHLVNHKNNSGVAFHDGIPEFVQKPGGSFKLKVLHNVTQAYNAGICHVPYSSPAFSVESNAEGGDYCEDKNRVLEYCNLVHMDIMIDKVIFTICHEVSDSDDKFPLLRGCIRDVHNIVQILPSKFRLICTNFISIDYFNVQRNIWSKIISHVDACIFIHSRVSVKALETVKKGIPTHYFFRIKQVDASLTELSLDILLFIAGKLNLAGPYALRNSIFYNCCKVDNQSSLNLICHFSDNQDAVVPGKQSSSIFLRHLSLVDQQSEIKSSISIYASKNCGFSTMPLNISLSNAQLFAWRTYVPSAQDSKMIIGPSLVVEISKKTEDGLSVTVSPLLRIHNATGFPLKLCLRTPYEINEVPIGILLKVGDMVDDSTPLLGGLVYSDGSKKAVMSLDEGKPLLSLKPDISVFLGQSGKQISVDWSEGILGGKLVPLSGIFDKLSYRFKKALGIASTKSSLSTVCCPLISEGHHVSDMHFLIRTIGKDVPIIETSNLVDAFETEASQFTFQREIYISPTVLVSNFLQTDILVALSENSPDSSIADCADVGKVAVLPCGLSAYFYANPSSIFFVVSLPAFNSKCKPVDSTECVKKLLTQKTEPHYFDIELAFNGGKYFACLRLTFGDRGMLEGTVFTPYTMRNDTELPLFCSLPGHKPFSRENNIDTSTFPPELGSFLPPKSTRSWFLKSNKVQFRLVVEKSLFSSLDLDTLSGFTELQLESSNEVGASCIVKLGILLKPCVYNAFVPAQLVSIVSRYIISNECMEPVMIRQCGLENVADGITQLDGKQKAVIYICGNSRKKSRRRFFDSVFRKHQNVEEDSSVFIQFCLKSNDCSWSGPICISSLGHFFIKFRSQPLSLISGSGSDAVSNTDRRLTQFASVHVEETNTSLVLHFHMPPDISPPYRIENLLHGMEITYYQKDSEQLDTLISGSSAEYAWEDLNLPHRLVVQISGMQVLREINIDKMCTWKPFFKTWQNKLLTLHSPLNRASALQKKSYQESLGFEIVRLGYEVYADGLTRVLRICEFTDSCIKVEMQRPLVRFEFMVGYAATSLVENDKQDEVTSIPQTFIIGRLETITLDLLSSDQCTFFSARIKSMNVDNRWQGAPFASMIRRSQPSNLFSDGDMLQFFFILHSNTSSVRQVKRFSLVLQPIDLNLDEETLMKIAAFWRTSLNDSKTQSQLYYFRQFEVHPLKIKASFLPGNPYSSYSSTQETLRSLLHSVIKVPAVKNAIIELNGVLLNHVLVTKSELLIKCARHYSWYAIRAVYMAKGSPLLPPVFASIFDDAASSSLDVFFDPSDGSINLPGLTLGMFKFVSKCIDSKGFTGTKRYFGDLGKTMKKAGSNVLFAAVTEVSDSILKGAEMDGFNGLVNGFHQGILRLAMQPSFLGAAVMQGGPDRKIVLDNSPGVNELYIEGYLQAMLQAAYKQEYLQVKVIDNMVYLKNLPPNSSLINEIVETVKNFLISQGLLKGETSSIIHHPMRMRGESEWRMGPMIRTLCEHLFVSFAIRALRREADKVIANLRLRRVGEQRSGGPSLLPSSTKENHDRPRRARAVGSFVFSGIFAYVDGWLCRRIPNPIIRRIVSGFLLTFLEKKDTNK